MAYYTIYSDLENHACLGFDESQMKRLCGNNPHQRFDYSTDIQSFKGIITEPLLIDFEGDCDGLTGTAIPDIQVHSSRIFLSEKAYNALGALLEKDGEFFPITYESGVGYIFNPLRTAEQVDGLNKELSVKNEWDEVENMVFHEDRIGEFALLMTDFDFYSTLHCREDVRSTIVESGLTGVNLTPELGAQFSMSQEQKSKPN